MKRLILILGLLTSFAYAQSKAGFYVVGGQLITVQDTSSRKYLKAVENAGVVPSVIQNFASNYLVTTEKAIGSYSLMSAQYPFIGGTAATHKFNLNDPRDLDVAFRLTYGGTITHSANGMQGDGSTGYANTYVDMSTIGQNSKSFGFYTNLLPTGNPTFEMSSRTSTVDGDIVASNFLFSSIRYSIGYASSTNSGQATLTNSTQSKGFYYINRNNSSNLTLYTPYASLLQTSTSGSFANKIMPLLAENQSTSLTMSVTAFSNGRMSYALIGLGLTDTQAIQQSQIVTFFNSIQGRQ